MTTYKNVESVNCRVEIGSTSWVNEAQRIERDTDGKHMLLRYAFEALNGMAVEFRPHFAGKSSVP